MIIITSPRPELTVACIAQAREDVAVLVQVVVNRGQMDGDIGMRLLHGGDPFRRADAAQGCKIHFMELCIFRDTHGNSIVSYWLILNALNYLNVHP